MHLQARYGGRQRGPDRAGPAAQVDGHVARTQARAAPSRTTYAVRCRGTNTPGSTTTRSPQNSAQPTSTSSGCPATRSSTSRTRSASSRAASRSSAASCSAKTQPAARSRDSITGPSSTPDGN